MIASKATWTTLCIGWTLAGAALLAGCGSRTRLDVKDDSSSNVGARVLHRLGSGPGGGGLEFDYMNTRAQGGQQLGAFESATLGSQSINGPVALRHTVRVQSAQLVYNHLLFAGRTVEMEWFAGGAWVSTAWESLSANPADPRLSKQTSWYGPAGGVLGRLLLAPSLALELRFAAAIDLSSRRDAGERNAAELVLAFKPVPTLTLRAGLAETQANLKPELLSTELSVRARGPFFNLGFEF